MPTSSPTSTLVVLVAPAGPLDGVRDVLQDWSALDLVHPFLWVQGPPASSRGRVHAIEIKGGRAAAVTLEEVLATRDHVRVRLCILVPSFRGQAALTFDVEERLSSLVGSTSGAAEVERLRFAIARPESGPGDGKVAREGWHNIVVSPEDSRGPALGHHRLDPATDAFDIGPHAAAAVCGLTGLWTGMERAPMDGKLLPPGAPARVARSYFRRLDADEVNQAVRNGVLSMDGSLPRPRVGSGRAVVVDDVPLATTTMARQLWTKHRDVLRGPRAARQAVTIKTIGAWQALKMLFGYLADAIKGAPMLWYERVTRAAASSAAAAVHGLVFGTVPAAYEVMVRGVLSDGSRAEWRDLASASAQMSELMAAPGAASVHAASTDLSRVWKDYVSACLTLADAGERSDQMPPIVVGVERGVVRSAWQCVPGAATDFTDIPAWLHTPMGGLSLQAADVIGVDRLRSRLKQGRSNPETTAESGPALQALDDWALRYQHSFAVQTGQYLRQSVTDLTGEVAHLLESLRDAGTSAQPSDELSRKQRLLAWWMRGLIVAFAVVCVTLTVLGATGELSWGEVAIGCSAAFVCWAVGTFFTFARGQRDVFAELNRRREAASQAEVTKENLGQALADLRRVTEAYGQFLEWSRILGVVVAQPFGNTSRVTPRPMLAQDGLPLSVRLGVAQPQPAVSSDTIARVRRNVYRAGWLTAPWEAILKQAPSRLGSDGIDLAEQPEQMYSERAGASGLLSRWADLLVTEGPGQVSGDMVWHGVLSSISDSPLGDSLHERVGVAGDSTNIQTRESFMNGIDRKETRQAEFFDGYLFVPSARANQADVVETSWQDAARDGLSESVVMVQLTQALPTYQLAGLETVEPPPENRAMDGEDF